MTDDLIMTKKQAIAILQNIKPAQTRANGKTLSILVAMAISMAIEALEQEHDLDKIRAEIKEKFDGCSICEWFDDYDYEENDISEYRAVGSIDDILQIIDKYKVEGIQNEQNNL